VDREKCKVLDITRSSGTKAGRPSVLDEETLQKLKETITAVRLEIGARVNISMAPGIKESNALYQNRLKAISLEMDMGKLK
jgi:hypothetical protein